jgi:hypothetical protein
MLVPVITHIERKDDEREREWRKPQPDCIVTLPPDFQPMRVAEEPVCIDLFWQNPVFTSLHLRPPVHVVPPQKIIVVFLLHILFHVLAFEIQAFRHTLMHKLKNEEILTLN